MRPTSRHLIAGMWVGLLGCSEHATEPAGLDAGVERAARITGSGHRGGADLPHNSGEPDQLTVVDPTPVGPSELLAVVNVNNSSCSGTLIGADTVLTAAHCVCTLNWYQENTCEATATVRFRPNPPGTATVPRTGVVVHHPDYNPSWSNFVIQEDLAVIKLDDVAPSYVAPIAVAQTFLPEGSSVRVAGYGSTGPDCTGPGGTLNADFTTFDAYEISNHPNEVMRFDDRVLCPGDSGGAILDPTSQQLLAVHSMHTFTLGHGTVNKSTTTTQHHNWIKDQMCFSSATNTCDGWGDPCNCSADNSLLWQASSGLVQMWFMGGGFIDHSTFPTSIPSNMQIQGRGDFDGDGDGDLLLRNPTTGYLEIRYLRDGLLWTTTSPGAPEPEWSIQGVADFDGDARADILWRHTNGQLAIWFRGAETGAAFPGYNNTPTPVELVWQVRGLGDFNRDGRADILWRRSNPSQTAIWFMSGGTRIGDAGPADPGATWTIQAIGDLDGNLGSDVLWRQAGGTLRIWFDGAPGANISAPAWGNGTGAPPLTWAVLGLGDVDHDGRDDILWRDTAGQIAVWIMEGTRVVQDLYPSTVGSNWTFRGVSHDDNQ